MTRGLEPGYEPPTKAVVEWVLLEAERHAEITGWKIVPLRVSEISPRENIHWISQKEFREWKAGLIEQYRSDPAAVNPIVVVKRKGEYLILDGHHRWRSAKLSGRKAIWVVQVSGRLKEPGYREKQEQW